LQEFLVLLLVPYSKVFVPVRPKRRCPTLKSETALPVFPEALNQRTLGRERWLFFCGKD